MLWRLEEMLPGRMSALRQPGDRRRACEVVESNAVSDMGDLFGEPELPAGFRYMPDVLSPAEERSLVQRFEKLPLKPFEFHGYQGNRRIYTFGHRYIFAGQDARTARRLSQKHPPTHPIGGELRGW